MKGDFDKNLSSEKVWYSNTYSNELKLLKVLCKWPSKWEDERKNGISWQFEQYSKTINFMLNPAFQTYSCQHFAQYPPNWVFPLPPVSSQMLIMTFDDLQINLVAVIVRNMTLPDLYARRSKWRPALWRKQWSKITLEHAIGCIWNILLVSSMSSMRIQHFDWYKPQALNISNIPLYERVYVLRNMAFIAIILVPGRTIVASTHFILGRIHKGIEKYGSAEYWNRGLACDYSLLKFRSWGCKGNQFALES